MARRAVAELLGTGFLLAAVVGSGIMGERLAGGNIAIALLVNTIATGAALMALIYSFGGLSGAHFNPVVTLDQALNDAMPWRQAPAYVIAQIVGAFLGVGAANRMFGLALFSVSRHARSGPALLLSEFIATFGLIMVIRACSVSRTSAVPVAVGAYIAAAYWFTASTSFANPAVTLARTGSDTFAGIRPIDVPGFIAAQLAGGLTASILCNWLLRPSEAATAKEKEA